MRIQPSKFIISYLFFFLIASSLKAQIFATGSGHIWFFSEAPIENIEAHSTKPMMVI